MGTAAKGLEGETGVGGWNGRFGGLVRRWRGDPGVPGRRLQLKNPQSS